MILPGSRCWIASGLSLNGILRDGCIAIRTGSCPWLISIAVGSRAGTLTATIYSPTSEESVCCTSLHVEQSLAYLRPRAQEDFLSQRRVLRNSDGHEELGRNGEGIPPHPGPLPRERGSFRLMARVVQESPDGGGKLHFWQWLCMSYQEEDLTWLPFFLSLLPQQSV